MAGLNLFTTAVQIRIALAPCVFGCYLNNSGELRRWDIPSDPISDQFFLRHYPNEIRRLLNCTLEGKVFRARFCPSCKRKCETKYMKEAVCSYTKRGIDLISARQAQSNEIISLENRRVAEQILAVHLEGLAKKSLEDLFKKDPKTFIGCLADA